MRLQKRIGENTMVLIFSSSMDRDSDPGNWLDIARPG